MKDKNRIPNCILLAADQLRYDVLGKGYTPHIDALMQDSVSFPNTYCASPLCVPARGALFTGTYPGVNGSLINGWLPSEKPYSLVKDGTDHLYQVMERLGMACFHSGKQHLFVEGVPLEERPDTKTSWLTTENSYRAFVREQGKRLPGGPLFRTQIPEMADGIHTRVCTYSNPHTGLYEEGYDYYFDGYFTNAAIRMLDEFDKRQPLFLSMMYLAPHPPFDIPDPWYSLIDAAAVELPDNVDQWYDHQSPLQKYNLTGYIGGAYQQEDWREAWRTYLGLVSLLDDCVGRLLDQLKEKDLYEDSIIVFTSDHGEMLGSHRLFQKMCMYEESAKVPLCIRIPGVKSSHIQQTVSHIDILPTLCHYLELECQHEMEGHSLHNLAEQPNAAFPYPVFLQYDGNSCLSAYQRCVVSDGYKLIMDVFQNETFFELYHVVSDPQEQRNLLFEDSHIKKAEQLYRLLCHHMDITGDTLHPSPDALADFLS